MVENHQSNTMSQDHNTECVLQRHKDGRLAIQSAPEIFLCTRGSIQDLIDRVLIVKEFRKDEKRQIPHHYVDNAIADEILFVHRGSGKVLTHFGVLPFKPFDWIHWRAPPTLRMMPGVSVPLPAKSPQVSPSLFFHGAGVFGKVATEHRLFGPVVVIAFSADDMPHYFAVAAELRAAGIPAEVYLGSSGMRPQMKYADRRNAPAAVILGGDEIAAGTVTVKDLDLGRELAAGVTDNAAWKADRPGQATIPRAELVGFVRRIIEGGTQ